MKEQLQKDFDNSIKNLSLSQKDIEIKKFCLENFIDKGFPNRKEEDWKFSDLNQIIKNNIGELSFYNDQASTNKVDTSVFVDGLEHNKIVFINGRIEKIDFDYEKKDQIEMQKLAVGVDAVNSGTFEFVKDKFNDSEIEKITEMSLVNQPKDIILQRISANNLVYKPFKTMLQAGTSEGQGPFSDSMAQSIEGKVALYKEMKLLGGSVLNNHADLDDKAFYEAVILNNDFLGMVRQWQQLFFDKRYASTEMINPDFVAIAKGYYIDSDRVEKRKDLKSAVKKMINSKKPYVLEICVEKEDNVFPMIPSGASVSDIRLN